MSVDCTEMDQAVREDFLMASRDRVRRNEAYDAIYGTLRDELREHPGLREHNALRKKKRLDETLSKEENARDYFQELLKSDPTLASILGIGGNIISTTGPSSEPVPFTAKSFLLFSGSSRNPKAGCPSPARSIARCAWNLKPMPTTTILIGPIALARSLSIRRTSASAPIFGTVSSPPSFRCPMTPESVTR